MATEPMCRRCRQRGELRLATDADHIVPRSRGGRDTLENLQSLCKSCHGIKSATEDGAFGNKARP